MQFINTMIIYKSLDWIKISIPMYKKHFKEQLLVVNNSNDPAESQFARDQGCIVIENKGHTQHGDGLDRALKWCKSNRKDGMIAIEPDCLVKGRRWYEALARAIEGGYWMAGLFKRSHGPIHPCPSAWRVDKVRHSFNTVPKGADIHHPRFLELFSLRTLIDNLAKDQHSDRINRFCLFMWDTGFKNWFDIATQNKAVHINIPDQDFIHLWHGSERGPDKNNQMI